MRRLHCASLLALVAAQAAVAQPSDHGQVAWISAGIIEWHGLQSAVGLDGLKAEALVDAAAKQFGGLRLPQLWLGPDASTPFEPGRFPRGTQTIDRALYDTAVRELLEQLEAAGCKVAVYLSGHYPGVIPKVAEEFNTRGRMRVLSISENLVIQGLPAGDHAATFETSILMALHPGLVRLDRLPPLPPSTRPAGEVIPPSWVFVQRAELYGIYGSDPRVWANATFGRRSADAVIDGLAREVGKLLADPAYGKDRRPIEWGLERPEADEVRCERLLPDDWLARFQKRPVILLPVTTAVDVEGPVRLARRLARAHGTMVYPPLAYAPGRDGGLALSLKTFERALAETVDDLLEMDFQLVGLLPGPDLSEAALDAVRRVAARQGEWPVLVFDDRSTAASALQRAVEAVPVERRPLQGVWGLDGGHQLPGPDGARYGPLPVRSYELDFDCDAAQARAGSVIELLGVCNRAEMFLNDWPGMVDHWPPYRFNLAGQLREGRNHLRVLVSHSPQPTLDHWYYQPGAPHLDGAVLLSSVE